MTRRFRTRRMRDFIRHYHTRNAHPGRGRFAIERERRRRPTPPDHSEPRPSPASLPDHVEWITADGRALPFAWQSFEICYSKSAIRNLLFELGDRTPLHLGIPAAICPKQPLAHYLDDPLDVSEWASALAMRLVQPGSYRLSAQDRASIRDRYRPDRIGRAYYQALVGP